MEAKLFGTGRKRQSDSSGEEAAEAARVRQEAVNERNKAEQTRKADKGSSQQQEHSKEELDNEADEIKQLKGSIAKADAKIKELQDKIEKCGGFNALDFERDKRLLIGAQTSLWILSEAEKLIVDPDEDKAVMKTANIYLHDILKSNEKTLRAVQNHQLPALAELEHAIDMMKALPPVIKPVQSDDSQ